MLCNAIRACEPCAGAEGCVRQGRCRFAYQLVAVVAEWHRRISDRWSEERGGYQDALWNVASICRTFSPGAACVTTQELQLLRQCVDYLKVLPEIRDALHALSAALAPAKRQRHPILCNGDRAALQKLLPAIAEAVGIRTFAIRELLAHAQIDIESTASLRAALDSVGRNPRKLGRLLKRATDVDIDGFRIMESGVSRDGTLRTVITITRRNPQN